MPPEYYLEYAIADPALGLGEFLGLLLTLIIAIRIMRGDWPFDWFDQ